MCQIKPKHSTSHKAKNLDTCKRTKHQKEAHQLDAHTSLNDTNKNKCLKGRKEVVMIKKNEAFLIEPSQEDNIKPDHGCKIRMLVGYGESEKLNATIITPKEEVDYQFWYPGRNKVIKDYKHMKTTTLGMMKLIWKVKMLKARVHREYMI